MKTLIIILALVSSAAFAKGGKSILKSMKINNIALKHFVACVFSFFISLSVVGSDISYEFDRVYNEKTSLTEDEVTLIKNFKLVFVPGFMGESFNPQDRSSKLDFSGITSDYFGNVQRYLKHKYEIESVKLHASSSNTDITKSQIIESLENNIRSGKKTLFITHSLGGLMLLDTLIEHENLRPYVAGNLFLQTPFWGTPLADIYTSNFFYVKTILTPVFKLLNMSSKTVSLFSPQERRDYMQMNAEAIDSITSSIPSITFAGRLSNWKSVFRSGADIIEYGCLRALNKFCITKLLHSEKFDMSDGVVPFESSKLPNVDYVVQNGVDHGETVLTIPFRSIDQKMMVDTLLKLLIEKLSRNI